MNEPRWQEWDFVGLPPSVSALLLLFQKRRLEPSHKRLNQQPWISPLSPFQKEVFWERSLLWLPISDDTQTRVFRLWAVPEETRTAHRANRPGG